MVWDSEWTRDDSLAALTAFLSLLILIAALCACCHLAQWIVNRHYQNTMEPQQVVVYHNGIPLTLTLIPEPYGNHYRILEAYEAEMVFGRQYEHQVYPPPSRARPESQKPPTQRSQSSGTSGFQDPQGSLPDPPPYDVTIKAVNARDV